MNKRSLEESQLKKSLGKFERTVVKEHKFNLLSVKSLQGFSKRRQLFYDTAKFLKATGGVSTLFKFKRLRY